MQIIMLDSLIQYVAYTIIIIASVYLLQQYKWSMRRLAALDAIDEGIRSCVERGKTVHFTPGIAGPLMSMTFSQTLPASMEVWRYACARSSELNVPIIGSCEKAETQLLMQDYARAAYTQTGHPERYTPRMVYYFATGSGSYGMVGLIQRENVGLHLSWGVFGGGTHLPQVAVANSLGAITIACNAYPMETAECALGADYPIIMEEEMASGVYLSDDPVQIASLLGEDFIKIIVSVLLIIFVVLVFAGVVPRHVPAMR